MQCREFDERIHWLLDERQLPQRDAQLLAHAQECEGCRQLLLAQESLFQEIDHHASPALASGFASRVVSQVRTSDVALAPSSAPRPWMLAVGVLATAAAALVGLTIAMNLRPNRPEVPAIAAPSDRNAGSQGAPAASLAGHGSAVKKGVQPASDLAKATDPPFPPTDRRLSPTDVESLEQYGQAIQSLASQVPQAVDRLDEVEQATPGLRPVRTSFTLAIGTIRRTIPPQRKAEPPRPRKRDSGSLWTLPILPV